MSMTDPIADFLARVRNGILAQKTQIDIPRSNVKLRIAEILEKEGYVDSALSVEDRKQGLISVTLRYDNSNVNAISGLRRVSRPGQRRYVKAKNMPKVRNGLGIAIVSTSRGLMTDRDARQLGVGGEVLCEVW